RKDRQTRRKRMSPPKTSHMANPIPAIINLPSTIHPAQEPWHPRQQIPRASKPPSPNPLRHPWCIDSAPILQPLSCSPQPKAAYQKGRKEESQSVLFGLTHDIFILPFLLHQKPKNSATPGTARHSPRPHTIINPLFPNNKQQQQIRPQKQQQQE
ncbi:MAG: hypothetical protein LQ349_009938, partial [Xanthoria aureola]